MNTHSRLAAALLLVVAAVSGWWLLKSEQQELSKPVETVAQVPAKTTETAPEQPPKSEMVQPFARTPYIGLKDPRWVDRRRLRREDPSYQWRTPIVFFGKVVDENGLPVAGADVEISWSGTVARNGGDGVGHRNLASDAAGFFAITGIEGKGMSVRVTKEGYHLKRSNNGWFEYAGFWEPRFIEPDRNHAVVFELVKRPVAEPTYRVGERMLLLPPAWTVGVDLLQKPAETTSGGDITLRILRPPNAGYKDPFDWELKIEGNGDAEFVESQEEFMLRAPDNGYQPVLGKLYKKMPGNDSATVRFYVRSKSRRLYAAVSLEVTPYYPMLNVDKACVIIVATVNPNNSPNLEYDPQKNIREMAKK